MATKAKKTDATVADKLDALYNLQKIDSEIDRIKIIRGELPLEVQDLEDEIEGLTTRVENSLTELKDLETEISDRKNAIKASGEAIAKYKEQQNNVRNNREYESLSKEMEFQSLEMEINEKKILEARSKIDDKKEAAEEAKSRLDFRKTDLEAKKGELNAIISETQKEEDVLMEKSKKAQDQIDERLVTAYHRLRQNARNGLAVVPIERDSCGGCFNKIPPQRQLDIQTKRKVIVCEHCGRILVGSDMEEA
jgi:predicted  nucleic acid-binding Zn-ribbon protein